MKSYCTNCGTPHEYKSVKPKFCSDCGNPFGGNVARAKQQVEEIEDEEQDLDETEEESSGIEVSLDKLDVEIERSERRVETLGQIAMTSNIDPSAFQPRPGEDLSAKKILKQFQDEAKTLRKNG